MTIRSGCVALAFLFGLINPGPASAVAIHGTSGGTFSKLTGCDDSGNDRECGIINTGNGSNTQVRWPYREDGAQISDASTLTSVDVTFDTATNANDVLIARLDWFNAATSAQATPDEFGVTWKLTLSFTGPNSSHDTESFALMVANPSNPTGDTIGGFSLANLADLTFDLDGITVSDLRYSVLDGLGACDGVDSSLNVGVWYNCEGNTASLLITADFSAENTSAVGEPATLAILATGLLGLAAVRRRRKAAELVERTPRGDAQ